MVFSVLMIFSAMAWITGTATELPNCLYAWVSETGMMKLLGNPWSLDASLGVIFLGFLPSCSIRISDPSL